MRKRLLLLSNGYGEDSFAALILEELLGLAEEKGLPLRVDVIPLVGEGKAFEGLLLRFPGSVHLSHLSPSLPYGGVYLGKPLHRFFRLFSDALFGGFRNILLAACRVRSLARGVDVIFGVGDILPLLLGFLFGRRKVFLFACAHTDLLRVKKKPYERLGRVTAYFLRHGTERVYTRDAPTALWFQNLGIPAVFPGFVGPKIGEFSSRQRYVLFLPGHRGDWEDNFLFLARAILSAGSALDPFSLHFAFPPERTLQEIEGAFARAGGRRYDSSSFLLGERCVSFSRGDYLLRLQEAALVVGFAGTALEHAAFCGIPCIEPYRRSAIQANPDFLFRRQILLLREALTPGGTTPEETARILEMVLCNLPDFQKKAREFSWRTWEDKRNGARNIACDLFSTLRTPPKCQGRAPVLGGSRTDTR